MGTSTMLRDDSIFYGRFYDILNYDILDFREGWAGPCSGGVDQMLDFYKICCFDLCSLGLVGIRERIALLRKRLDEIEAIETEHGKGCLLDLDNYFVQQIIAAGGLVEEQANAIRYRNLMAAPSSTYT